MQQTADNNIDTLNIDSSQYSVPFGLNIKSKWKIVEKLTKYLDTSTAIQSTSIAKECMKLEIYVNSEYLSIKKELYFNNQEQLIELYKSIQSKLLRLTRAIELFDNQILDLVKILEGKVNFLVECDFKPKLKNLENQYFNLVSNLKIELKVKMSKLEGQFQLWKDLDELCHKLHLLFEDNRTNIVKQLSLTDYNELVLKISTYLNQLRKLLSILSPILTEDRNRDTSNLIVWYECQLSKLKKDFEEQQEYLKRYFSKSNESDIEEASDHNEYNYLADNESIDCEYRQVKINQRASVQIKSRLNKNKGLFK